MSPVHATIPVEEESFEKLNSDVRNPGVTVQVLALSQEKKTDEITIHVISRLSGEPHHSRCQCYGQQLRMATGMYWHPGFKRNRRGDASGSPGVSHW